VQLQVAASDKGVTSGVLGGSMILVVLAIVLAILASLACLRALIVLVKRRRHYPGHPLAYRLKLSALIALLCPTLVLGGHGGLPIPTVGGLTAVLVTLQSIHDLRISLIAFGHENAAVLILPAPAVFLLVFATLCVIFGESEPKLFVWNE